jgi:hypothetical protein
MDKNISFTEKEYDYAVQFGIPTLGFVIDEDSKLSSKFFDSDKNKIELLANFKKKIKKKYISYWKDKNDLYGKVSVALMKQFTTNPRIGWIRSNEIASADTFEELTRLSRENSELRNKIQFLKKQGEEEEHTEIESIINILKKNKKKLSFFYIYATDWDDGKFFSYYDLYRFIVPTLMIETSVEDLSIHLGLLRPNEENSPRQRFPVPKNTIKEFLADLSALGLIIPSPKKHEAKDTKNYWSVSEKGKEIYFYIRRQRLEDGVKKETLPLDESPI